MKNKKNKIILAIFVCSIICFFSANSFAQTIDELSSTVAFLSEKITDDEMKYGTGFFVANGTKMYLVTAEHVAKFLTVNSTLTIRTTGDIPLSINFSDIVGSKTNLNWSFHEEGDVGILPLSPNDNVIQQLEKHFIPISYIYSKNKSVSREVTLTILGFPLALGRQGSFSPISRETKPASGFLVLNRFDNKKPATFFITQDPSIGGFSGAPVFDTKLPLQRTSSLTIRSGKPMIVGITHGTLNDTTGGKLGAITPSYQLKELIENHEKQISNK